MDVLRYVVPRSLIAFFALLLVTRLLGKKQLSHLTFFDYIVGITIGDIGASLSIDRGQSTLGSLVSLALWVSIPILLNMLSKHFYGIRRLVNGAPAVLIQNGKIHEHELRKSHMTANDLMQLLREKHIFKLADVEFAVLETNGKLSVLPKSEQQPVTPKVLGMTVEQEQEPRIVVMDGSIMERTLKSLGHTKEWLTGELKKAGASDVSDVFLAQIDGSGNLYVDLLHDTPTPSQPKVKPMVLASLKKLQADLEMYALQTESDEARTMYSDQAAKLERLVHGLQSYLKA